MPKAIFINYFLFVYFSQCLCLSHYELNIYGETQNGFYISLFLGTPPQNVNVLLDTGSSNFAVACVPPSNNKNTYFHYMKSSTFEKSNTSVDLHYVQGHWNGFLGKDDVHLINKKDKATKCMLACMTNIHNVFDYNSKFEGVLGLAYSVVSHPNSKVIPFFDTVRNSNNISNLFTLNLCGPYFSDGINSTTTCGKLYLGDVPSTEIKSDVIYTPILRERFYEIMLTDLSVGMKTVVTDCKLLNKPRALIDSGTTNFMLSKSLYYKTLNEIKNSIEQIQDSFWLNETVGCFPRGLQVDSVFPIISLSLFHSDHHSFDLRVTSELYLIPFNSSESSYTCFMFGIGLSDFGTIIGSTILKGFYVVFDRNNRQIGFANSSYYGEKPNSTSYVSKSHPSFIPDLTFQTCQPEEPNDNETVSAGIIILLILALVLTVLLLHMMITWIKRYLIKRSEYHSDTNSLVGDDSDSIYSY